MKIRLDNNKHICLFFHPRSGSTLLQNYICDLTARLNLRESFNLYSKKQYRYEYKNNTLFSHDEKELDIKSSSQATLNFIKEIEKENVYTFSNAWAVSIIDKFPELLDYFKHCNNLTFLNLYRADYLYSLISIRLANRSNSFHSYVHLNDKNIDRTNEEPIIIDPKSIEKNCKEFVLTESILMDKFGLIPKIYYEQFETNPANIINLFENLPKKIIRTRTNKNKGNYRFLVSNYKEIEECFVDFVNNHKEFFPQYFGAINNLQPVKLIV